MNLSIQPLIDLADTDRELQIFIHSKSQLEKQIDTASSVVNQHKKTIELNPNISEAYNNLGLALKNTGNKNESIEYFIKALNYDAKNTLACENLIKVLTTVKHNKNQDNKYIYVNSELQKLKFNFDLNERSKIDEIALGIKFFFTFSATANLY